MIFSTFLRDRAAALLALYRERGLTLVTAESCTGGLIAGLLTEIPGSSNVVERGYVTYSNISKEECLGVPHDLLERFGAVSTEVAEAMAIGALKHSAASIAISVTGIAGPDGGSIAKPVGLIYFGYGRAGQIATLEKRFGNLGRTDVRLAAVATALDLLLKAID
jgi:nicotinamide-nucleotide amidase